MSCVVPGCNNHSAKTKKAGDSVSYFHMPAGSSNEGMAGQDKTHQFTSIRELPCL